MATVVAGMLFTTPASARGEDVCAESNDTFQSACFLGVDSDALGFISTHDDADAYRFEVRDFGATVSVTLPERPLPYRLSLANWNGDVIASDPDGTLQLRLPLPGSYYVFVDSATGEFSDTAPYRIAHAVTYASGAPPTVLYNSELRGGPRDVFDNTGTNTASTELADFTIEQGRLSIALRDGATPEAPAVSGIVLTPEPPDNGPIVEDFTMSVDTRLVSGGNASYFVRFRFVDHDNHYVLAVSPPSRSVRLDKIVAGEMIGLTDWIRAPSVQRDTVNRTVIVGIGDELRINVNGQEAVRVQDRAFARGLVGFGAISFGGPATFNFDNILVTTPTRR